MRDRCHAAELAEEVRNRLPGEIRTIDNVIGKISIGTSLRLERVLVAAPARSMGRAVDIQTTDRTGPRDVHVEGCRTDLWVVGDRQSQIDAVSVQDLDVVGRQQWGGRATQYEGDISFDALFFEVAQRFEGGPIHRRIIAGARDRVNLPSGMRRAPAWLTVKARGMGARPQSPRLRCRAVCKALSKESTETSGSVSEALRKPDTA